MSTERELLVRARKLLAVLGCRDMAWRSIEALVFEIDAYLKEPVHQHSRAALAVLAERHRQIKAEGWTTKHDDKHTDGSLALAAGCYAINAATWTQCRGSAPQADYADLSPGTRWPWLRKWWKPKNPRSDLIRAAALIIAEIERQDRANGEKT